MEPISTALLAASVGQKLWGAFSGKRKEKNRRNNRMNYFNNELKPLLDESTQDADIDFSSLRAAELENQTSQFQNQMRDITRASDVNKGRSGFSESGFIEQDYDNNTELANKSFNEMIFNTDRGLIDLQSQLESITNQNRLRAKEIEYEYKYG